MKRGWIFFVLLALPAFSGAADAALTPIGTANYEGNSYNLIYDNLQELVWLDYKTTDAATWGTQMAWASGLNTPGALTYNLNDGVEITWENSWRLPSAGVPPISGGHNNTTSEMGHLFYISLENEANYLGNGDLLNKGPFDSLEGTIYWSETSYEWDESKAWSFSFYDGNHYYFLGKDALLFAMAVHPAYVAPVPIPATMLLLGSGLVGLAGFRRKFRKH